MNKKTGPVGVGVESSDGDGVLARYAKGAKSRTEATRAATPPGPDVLGVDALYDPKRDGSRTIAQMASHQAAIAAHGAPPEGQQAPVFSPETVAGLTALKAEVEKNAASKAAEAQAQGKPAAEAPGEPAAPKTAPQPEMDDYAFDRLLNLAGTKDREDLINNERERDAVDKRVEPIDVLDGIAFGEYRQIVPIVPGKLNVSYRSVSPQEDQAIRLYILKLTAADGRYETVSSDLYSLLTLACGISQINTSKLPEHFTRKGIGLEVDETTLVIKGNLLLAYPIVLVHALGTHQFWFERRVRKAFVTVDLGNG